MQTIFFLIASLAVILSLQSIVPTVKAAYCHGHPHKDARRNTLPFIENAPALQKSTKNGKLYTITSDDGNEEVKVLHVYGSAYDMGYAHGELVHEHVKPFMDDIWDYMKSQIDESIQYIPRWIRKLIEEYGLDIALDLTYDIMAKYIGQHFIDELQGLSDASGVSYKKLRRIHMIGELTQGKCSMLGAWDQATVNGTTVQLRAFDWIVEGAPFKDHPSIIVYHPDDSNTFANIGFIGWIGSFSGMSAEQMAISEIGVDYPDDTFGKESRWGVPFVFLLRDILQFDKTLDDSINRILSAHRTCDLILGVGDGKLGEVRGFSYSYSQARVFDDVNMQPKNNTWHPAIKDTVYWGMDWNCPPYSKRMSERIKANHGKISSEVIARDISALTTTGDLQVSVYDLTHQTLLVAFARRKSVTQGDLYAYNRPYFKIDMNQLFKEPSPHQ